MHGSEGAGAWQHALATRRFRQQLKAGVGQLLSHWSGLSMTVGRFGAMVGALVWRQSDGRYLLLKRSEQKDFAPGQWECVTGRVEHGESFSEAVCREALEELGQAVQVEFIVGTTHFYRGVVGPEQEMV